MRVDINLATQPYQDAGRFYRRWSLALVAMTLLSAVLVYAAMNDWRSSQEARRELSNARSQLAKLESWQKADTEILAEPQNREVRDHSELLNDIIRRKGFSWTQAFSDLEQLMPGRLHVTSISPEMTADNQLAIRMNVAGDSRERAVELLRRMEQSRRFRQPAIDTEKDGAKPPDSVQFQISALYIPQPPASAPAQTPQARPQTQTAPSPARRANTRPAAVRTAQGVK